MTEGVNNTLSKLERAKRVADAYKRESMNMPDDCVAEAVAFTHGHGDDERFMGLHHGVNTIGIIDASKEIAAKHGEEVKRTTFDIKSPEQVLSVIEPVLKSSRAVWLIYHPSENSGHMSAAINEGEGKYLFWNAMDRKQIRSYSAKEIADLLVRDHIFPEVSIHLLEFTKK